MNGWESFKWALDWASRIQFVLKVLGSLGLASVLRALIIKTVPAEWLWPMWLFSVLAFLVLIEYGPWKRLWRVFKRSPSAFVSSPVSPATPATSSPPWYAQMVTNDQTRMEQRLFAVKWEPHRALEFDRTEPYIEFGVTFVNASVFDLNKPETIKGKVKFRNQPLAAHPQLEKTFPMPRGNRTLILVRQFVTPNTAQEIRNAISSDQATMLDFSEVKIPFTGYCDGVANVTFEWAGPNAVSFKDVTPL